MGQSVPFSPLLRIVLVLAVFHLPWPGLGSAFSAYFGQVAAWLLDFWSAPTLDLRLGPAAPSGPAWSVVFDARDGLTGHQARALLDVRRVGWLPLGAFMALMAAFPVKRWPRRLMVGVLGLAALHALSVLPVLAIFGDKQTGFFEVNAVFHTVFVVAQRALLTLPGMAYAGPALLWMLLSWRLEPELM